MLIAMVQEERIFDQIFQNSFWLKIHVLERGKEKKNNLDSLINLYLYNSL